MGEHNEDEAGRPHRGERNRQRLRVLELVREHDGPIDAAELGARLGLHTTTVRFHLDALCAEGLVERTRITRAGVGRPAPATARCASGWTIESWPRYWRWNSVTPSTSGAAAPKPPAGDGLSGSRRTTPTKILRGNMFHSALHSEKPLKSDRG